MLFSDEMLLDYLWTWGQQSIGNLWCTVVYCGKEYHNIILLLYIKEKAEKDNIEKKYHRISEEKEALTQSLKYRQEELEASLEGKFH